MLSRLLSNLVGIDARLLDADGVVRIGEGEGDVGVLHEASRLDLGPIHEIWIEAESTTVITPLSGGASLWMDSETLPIGRLSLEARTLRPVIEDLIEV